jgi:hypothetical protein
VIAKIPPDTRKILNDIDTGMAQFAFIADARLHQQLGRVDRAERKHDLAASPNPMRPPAAKEFYFGRSPDTAAVVASARQPLQALGCGARRPQVSFSAGGARI